MSLNPANTQISADTSRPAIYVRGQANAARLGLSGETGNITAAACTYTLLDPGGVTLFTTAATITAGACSASLTALHLPATATVGGGYIERWALTIGSTVQRYEREVIVGIRDLLMPVQLTDLTGRYTTLNNQLGARLDTWQNHLERAWSDLLRRLSNDGVFIFRALTPSALRDPHEHLTLARIFRDLGSTQPLDSAHNRLAADHLAMFEVAYTNMRASLDANDLGRIDDPSAKINIAPSTTYVNAAPCGSRYRAWSSP